MSYIQQERVAVKPAGPAQAAEAQFGLLRRGRIEAPDEGPAEPPPSRRAGPLARTARSLPTEGREEACGAGAERRARDQASGRRPHPAEPLAGGEARSLAQRGATDRDGRHSPRPSPLPARGGEVETHAPALLLRHTSPSARSARSLPTEGREEARAAGA